MDQVYVESLTEVVAAGQKLAAQSHVEGLLILATPDDGYKRIYDDQLSEIDIPVFGGVFPEVVSQGQKQTSGAVLCGLTTEPRTIIIPNLSDKTYDYETHLDPNLLVEGYSSLFVFVDAYATEVNRVVEALFRMYGVDFSYIGGGAGTLAMEQQPCLFTNEGLLRDSAVIAAVDIPLQIGVRHGWQEIAGPFRVTDAAGSAVSELDGRPAFDVYADVLNNHASDPITKEDFFEIAKSYPFGIARLDGEWIVRDPFGVDDTGRLSCFGHMPEGEFVHILEGDPASLIEAAASARTAAQSADQTSEALFFFDCISRALYLQHRFDEELARVTPDDTTLAGALTIGEIANDGAGHLDYYNKTTVVGAAEWV